MYDKPVYLTEQGFIQLRAELEELQTVRRPGLLHQLQEIQGGGDWMDNADDVSIREELAFVDGRIEELDYMLGHGQLLELGQTNSHIVVGSTAIVQEDDGPTKTFTIVGKAESDPAKGLISNESPLGHALLKHKAGDEIHVKTPGGEVRFHILAVS